MKALIMFLLFLIVVGAYNQKLFVILTAGTTLLLVTLGIIVIIFSKYANQDSQK